MSKARLSDADVAMLREAIREGVREGLAPLRDLVASIEKTMKTAANGCEAQAAWRATMSEIRLRLEEEHFRQLVAGKTVKIPWDEGNGREYPIKIILEDIGWDRMAQAIYDAMDANIDDEPDIMGAGPAARMYTRAASQRAVDRIQRAREVVEVARKAREAINADPLRFIRDPDGPLEDLWKALEAHDAVGAGKDGTP